MFQAVCVSRPWISSEREFETWTRRLTMLLSVPLGERRTAVGFPYLLSRIQQQKALCLTRPQPDCIASSPEYRSTQYAVNCFGLPGHPTTQTRVHKRSIFNAGFPDFREFELAKSFLTRPPSTRVRTPILGDLPLAACHHSRTAHSRHWYTRFLNSLFG